MAVAAKSHTSLVTSLAYNLTKCMILLIKKHYNYLYLILLTRLKRVQHGGLNYAPQVNVIIFISFLEALAIAIIAKYLVFYLLVPCPRCTSISYIGLCIVGSYILWPINTSIFSGISHEPLPPSINKVLVMRFIWVYTFAGLSLLIR